VCPSSKRVPQPPLGGPRRLVAAPIQNLPVAAQPSAGCSKRTRRGIRPVQPAFPWTPPNAHAGWLSLRALTGTPNRCRRAHERRLAKRMNDVAHDRLMTIADLWMMHGVPVNIFTAAGVIGVKAAWGGSGSCGRPRAGPVPGPAVIRHRCRGSGRPARRRSTLLHQGRHLRECRPLGTGDLGISPRWERSHSRTVRSAPAVTRVRPSGANATVFTESVWPVRG
jgi:hypothetical protein